MEATLKQKKREITPEEWEKIDKVIEKYKNKTGTLIPVLKEVQDICGFLPPEVQKRIADGLNLSLAQVYGVVTFYAFFTMVPRGKYIIRVCLGTACYVKGAPLILEALKRELGINVGETTDDLMFSLEEVRCLGACGLAPVMVVGQDTHGGLTPAKAIEIIKSYKEGRG